MKSSITGFVLIFCLAVGITCTAQQIIIDKSLRSTSFLDGSLFKFTMINASGGDQNIHLRAELYHNGTLVGYQEGMGANTAEVLTGADLTLLQSSIQSPFNELLALGILPEGQFRLCIRQVNGSGTAPCETFYSDARSNMQYLRLTTPLHKSVLTDVYPVLSWVGMLDGVSAMDVHYSLHIAEKNLDERGEYYTNTASPAYFQVAQLSDPVFPYPPDARELQPGKTYEWRVDMYAGSFFIARSEVWEFSIKAPEELNELPIHKSYIDIAELSELSSYYLGGSLKLRHTPRKTSEEVGLRILNTRGEPVKLKTDRITFSSGRPYATVNLADNNALKHLKEYVIELTLPTGQVKRMKMTYVNPSLATEQ